MRCSQARRALLEADPGEMRGEGDTPLALHLRECTVCERLAAFLLRQEGRLGEALLREMPTPDLEAALEVAMGAPRARGPGDLSEPALRTPAFQAARGHLRSSSTLKRGLTLLPLATAAAAIGVLLSREPPLPGDPFLPEPPPGVEAEAPPGRSLAVFRTADPDITVVWLF